MRPPVFPLLLALVAGCSTSPAAAPAATPGADGGPGGDDVAARPELTAAACEAQGGTVVGDIGDGAIHRPDYRCPESGEAPIGSIVPEPDGPIAIEGAVCCRRDE